MEKEREEQNQCFNNNQAKQKSALSSFRENSASLYLKSMIQAGISGSELEVNSTTYLLFVQTVLLTSFQNLHNLKKRPPLTISEDEHKYLNLLTYESSLSEDPKINMARNSFVEGLPKYLKQIMLDSGYEAVETEDNNSNYLSFLSEVLIMEAEKLIYVKSVLNKNNQNKKRTIDECLEQNVSGLPSGNFDLSRCPVKIAIEASRHCIYCVDTPDGLRAVKINNKESPTIEDTQNLDNELKVGSEMTCYALRKSYAMTIYQNKKALVLEWVNGYPLSDLKKLTVHSFIHVAREITSCVLAIHTNEICHLNLTCDHIILNSETNSIKIIGCGLSSSFCSKRSHNPKFLGRDLRYISPEQTGRVNREVDHRSDFYSLGIIFYRMLTGYHPFDSPSAMKIVEKHIFDEPTPLHVKDPNIPLPISNMVSKLMEKDADSRYKSAKGIMHDIDLIISDYKPGVEIVLAQHDSPETVLFPQKLYGLTNEYSTLLSVYNRALSSSFEVVFVKGNSGTGKSSFVRELNNHTMRYKQIFICGKYDCSKSEPYAALIQAMKMFCDIMELEDQSTLAKYRSKIKDAVGQEGRLLTNFVENLQSIIGKQPEISESFGAEAKNRFNYLFVKFIKAIASVSCPLVLCLDDLQWADSASLDLLKVLVDGSVNNLLIIGNYRDNEVKDEHKLAIFIEALKKMNVRTTDIKLDNMNQECINQFLADSLNISPLDSVPLTAFVYKITKGNPFFVKQMMEDLLEKELITYNYEKNKWVWELSLFNGVNIAENVLDLLKQKIKSLNEYTQEALIISSCLGGTFSLSSLRLIINNSKGVEDALATGMIIQCKGSDMGCFAHDQVKHAAQSLLPTNPKPTFLRAARKLCKLLSTDDLNENIYTVVNLFYLAKDMVNDSERPDVTNLFQLAGERAMDSSAPIEAFEYFKTGIELLEKESWKTRYEFTNKIFCNAAIASYGMTNYKFMDRFNQEIFKNAKAASDLVTPYLLLIRMYSDKRMHNEVFNNTSIILDKLGESLEMNQSITDILQTKKLLDESFKSVMEMRKMDDLRLLSVMEILHSISFSAFISVNRQIYASLALKMVQLTMHHGLSKYSAPGFCHFAVVLRGIKDKSSFDVGKLALKVLEKTRAKEMIPSVNVGFFTLISPYYAHLRKSLDPLRRAAIVSVEIGSHHYVTTTFALYLLFSFFCGEPLSKLVDAIAQFDEVLLVSRSKLYLSLDQAILNLLNTSIENPGKLSGETYDYKFCFEKDGVKFDIAHTSVISAMIAYLFYDYETASQLMAACKPLVNYLDRLFIQSMFYFFDGLVTAVLARNAKDQVTLIKTIKEDITILKKFVKNAPENYLHKVHLLEAELAVVCKKHSEAKSHYQKAISLSNEHGFLNEEAMSRERCAIFYLELESQSEATKQLVASFNCYKAWKAESKMLHLVQTYPFLVDALKSSPIILGEGGMDGSDSVQSVSALTSSASLNTCNTWQQQIYSRLEV